MDETSKQGLLSVVLPSYNEEASIPRAADTISALLTGADIPHEIIFVDDGSRDRTWDTIQTQTARHPRVRGVRFSRMASRVSTARRSSSLKSEARDMSIPVALLMME